MFTPAEREREKNTTDGPDFAVSHKELPPSPRWLCHKLFTWRSPAGTLLHPPEVSLANVKFALVCAHNQQSTYIRTEIKKNKNKTGYTFTIVLFTQSLSHRV